MEYSNHTVISITNILFFNEKQTFLISNMLGGGALLKDQIHLGEWWIGKLEQCTEYCKIYSLIFFLLIPFVRSICCGYWHLCENKNTEVDYRGSHFCPFRLITASSFSTYSPANMGGYLLALGDSAKWPRGFKTASDAIWANNYIQ